jgi:hypothetical protein
MAELKSLRERFYELVHKEEGGNGHWIWLGRRMTDKWGPRVIFDLGRNRKGDNKIVIATRFAWEDVHGTSLNKKRLKRLCGNKLCVNPAHYTLHANQPKDRQKLLELALTAGEKDLRREPRRRHEKQAPYLAMHWAKGIAKELVRQRAILVELVQATNMLLSEIASSRAAVDRAHAEAIVAKVAQSAIPKTEPVGASADAPIVGAFRSSIPRCVVSNADAPALMAVFDSAIKLRLADEGGHQAAVELFQSWLAKFSAECANWESAPTAPEFVAACERYERYELRSLSSTAGEDGAPESGVES